MTSLQDLAREAAGRVLSDLTDRQGIGDAITLCDEEIQNEIRDTVTSLILPSLEAAVGERDKQLEQARKALGGAVRTIEDLFEEPRTIANYCIAKDLITTTRQAEKEQG